MSQNRNIKTCRYKKCRFPDRRLNIAEQDYVSVGRVYYHRDCYEEKKKEDDAEERIKADVQLIKNMWIENISNTVVLSQLYLEINRLIRERGIDSKYIIFVLNYCIINHCNLRYPAGLKYYVDKQEIKDAFKKASAKKIVNDATFNVDPTTDSSPKFTINKKPSGFNSILGGKR